MHIIHDAAFLLLGPQGGLPFFSPVDQSSKGHTMPYAAPVKDFRFIMDHVAGFNAVSATDRFGEATSDMVDAILTEAGKMCDDILAPLQRPGDLHPAHLENGVVRTSPGFAEGYKAIAEGGWVGIAAEFSANAIM
jgi:hypothetical protein